MAESSASQVGTNKHGVGVKELVYPMQRSVCQIAVDRRNVRVLEALNELVDSGGHHGGGLTN